MKNAQVERGERGTLLLLNHGQVTRGSGGPYGPRDIPTVGTWGEAVSYERGTPVPHVGYHRALPGPGGDQTPQRKFFIDNLLVRIHFIIFMLGTKTSCSPTFRPEVCRNLL